MGKKKNKKKSSSWGGVIKSYLKEFLLDYDMGSWYDRESEDAENLTKEGRRKKNLLGAVAWILVGVCLGALPFINWEICAEQPIAAVIVESAAIGTVILGIFKLKK